MNQELASTYLNVGFFELIGIELVHSEEFHVTGILKIGSQHQNRAGNVHGGVLCSMIDFAACAAGLHSEPGETTRYGVTLSLTTQFTKAVSHGRLRVEGRVLSAGRKNYSAEAHIYDDAGDLVAHGIGSFQWRPGSQPGTKSMTSTKE
jgi:uncharacterized protein (TIGR00369 family)